MEFPDIDPEKIIIDEPNRARFRKADRLWQAMLAIYYTLVVILFLDTAYDIVAGTYVGYLFSAEEIISMEIIQLLIGWPILVLGHQRMRRPYHFEAILHQDGIITTTGKLRDSLKLRTIYRLIPNSDLKTIEWFVCTTPGVYWRVILETEDALYMFDGESHSDYLRVRRHLDWVQDRYRIQTEESTITKEQWFGEEMVSDP